MPGRRVFVLKMRVWQMPHMRWREVRSPVVSS